MRYEYAVSTFSGFATVRGELSPEQVAKLAAEGIPLALLRRRHYRRGNEQHVGEYTDQEHDALLADGWELVKVLADGEDVAPTAATTVTEAQRIAIEHPELPATVRAAFAALQSLVSIGVNLDLSAGIPGWQDIGPAIAARRQEITTLADYAALDAAADAADGHWRAVVYWCGSDATAYRLAPELAAIGV